MKKSTSFILLLASVTSLTLPRANATDTILHNFTSATFANGATPFGSLTLSGSTLFGMTSAGGSAHDGVAFSLNADGTAYTLLHTFTASATDGSGPYGNLTLSGSTLYGMTPGGGSSGLGMAFSMNTDGSAFTDIHDFAGSADGSHPQGSLTLSGSTLFGMTNNGGTTSKGVIFSMNTSGSGYSILHTFNTIASDGLNPLGSLTLSGTTLYGMTYYGGANNDGAIFKINTNGTGYSVLYSFSTAGGYNPNASLTISGSTLYGTTYTGGANTRGTVFSISTSGTNFTVLHSFGGTNDAIRPEGSLALLGSTLFGTASGLGPNGGGNVFRINTDGTGYTVINNFGSFPDGSGPTGDVTLSSDGTTLYGTTSSAGSGSNGTVFSAPTGVPEPSTGIMILAGCAAVALRRRRAAKT